MRSMQLVHVREGQKFHGKTKKMRRLNNDELDNLKQTRAMSIQISGPLIMAKADSLAEKLKVSSFKASRGWLVVLLQLTDTFT